MKALDLRRRYEFGPGWNEESILDVLINFIEQRGMIEEAVSHMDAVAEQEMEIYAGFSQEE